MSDPQLRLGIDIGGTFTDMVLADGRGDLLIGKELTAHSELAAGTVAAATSFVEAHGFSMSDVEEIVHGTTLASNVVLERKGWPTALLTTEGFRDLLVIQRQRRHDLYDLFGGKPEPLIARSRVLEVPERVAFDGRVLRALDEEAVERLAHQLVEAGIRAVAVSLLHSYRNPVHEQAVADILRREAPELFVSISSEISQRFREYERTSTTVVNAYIAGEVRRYLEEFESRLVAAGFDGVLHIMQSNGGVAVVRTLLKYPVRLLESGPAAGALMAAHIGAVSGHPLAISFDMGGTTAKLGLTENGVPGFTDEFEVDRLTLAPGSGLPIDVTAVDLVEIGAGGGSIASARDGLVSVGHESAGSEPGPACYARGGQRPTVTDANLVLGYLNPDYFLGGAMPLSVDAAREAIDAHVARPLGLSVEQAAWGIHELATESMAAAARVVSVDRGRDPRDFCLIAFGGAGPAHAVRIAKRVGIPNVIFPRGAGVASAMGLLSCDIRFEVSRSSLLAMDGVAAATIDGIYEELAASLGELLAESDADPQRTVIARSADFRYAGQGYELEVAVDAQEPDEDALACAVGRFHDRYHEVYGYSHALRAVEGTTWRMTGVSARPRLELPRLQSAPLRGADSSRPVYFEEAGGFIDCPVYHRAGLAAAALDGPAVIEERECTSVVPPGCTVRVDPLGNLSVSIPTEPAALLAVPEKTHA